RAQLEQLTDEVETMRSEVVSLYQERDSAGQELGRSREERDQLLAAQHDLQEQLEAMKRQLEQEAAAHQEALSQVRAELESLRSEHATAVQNVEAITGERDRVATAQEQFHAERQEVEQARQAERAEFTQQLEALHRQVEAETSRGDDFAQQHRALQA